ncbi:hypothetical protein R3X28_02190 [Maribacter sp. TH_r10]|uniref:hypothetical protein n=1 Tax=Maribacter sp. TH_r10 TaxID=3082086 RepID=UPI002955A977|nr:hypothetical protein [Maribacter sp. TH_r10]MDV7137662.1 hypothetical protein [Maribacter sp. TH_r10]
MSCQLYACSLKQREYSKEKHLMVTFDYEMSSSLKESLLASGFFNKEEKTILDNTLSRQLRPTVCKVVKDILIDKRTINVKGDLEGYLHLSYSVPIQINQQMAYLIVGVDRIRKNRVGSVGAVIIETFKKDADSWVFIDSKILESY